ncbi:unnamed protein product [Thlaspi arvense]|uniref:MATH domain-containing protein n=1 Tax=Thlaspi arvense TaxID=13288 RepID=A0AAU9RQJ8_THLAR|nr:unnamed protein product [Thlaspi arvense]
MINILKGRFGEDYDREYLPQQLSKEQLKKTPEYQQAKTAIVEPVRQPKELKPMEIPRKPLKNFIEHLVDESPDEVSAESESVKVTKVRDLHGYIGLKTMDVNGFEVLASQVESVRHIFQRHPDIAAEFRAKNQRMRKACMSFLLSVIETSCQSLEELSNEDLVEADIAITYLKDACFKVDWLEKKLNQLKDNKEKEKSGLARLQKIEENLLNLKLQWSEMDHLA